MMFLKFLRRVSPAGRLDWVRAGLSALCGIATVTLISRFFLGGDQSLPFLVAPIGASAVLVFAVPASPLARPWSVIGGNTISALVGIACVKAIPDPLIAGATAVAGAIVVMNFARCLHPPGGAVALTTVLSIATVAEWGWLFALFPVGLNSLLLVVMALLLNNASRHRYPHRAQPVSTAERQAATDDIPARDRVGYTLHDIDRVLSRYDDLLDVSPEDLDVLFRQVETRAYNRLHGRITCGAIMSRDIICAQPGEGVGQARDRLLANRLGAMPVVEEGGAVVGLVGHAELVAGAGRTVAEVMQTSPYTATEDTPISDLLPVLSGNRYYEAIVVDPEGCLKGLITQTDLLAVVWRGHVAEQVVSSTAKDDMAQAAA